ncbi:MAG: hypothetical protein KAI24_20955, partial [Planctomycetes bacterium]|nr:hypothetical protein [Planctomycetota bacterium]
MATDRSGCAWNWASTGRRLEITPTDEHPAFGDRCRQRQLTMTEACRRFGTSLKTGYKIKVEAAAPKDVWPMDYKGWVRLGDGTRCDPLTVNHVCSRASLVCHAMVSPKSVDVKQRLECASCAFGMPRFMLSEGGPPFETSGLGRLSRLGVLLVRVGVVPVPIEPGGPDQNGRHERFHETLK